MSMAVAASAAASSSFLPLPPHRFRPPPLSRALTPSASPWLLRRPKTLPPLPAKMGTTVAAATLPLFTFEGETIGKVELNLKEAPATTAKAVVHRGVITELQNRRRGTASTLTRGEVRGGGKKPYRQKGTGNARRGSQRTPLRPGGGVAFGPKPKDWSIKINKKEKRLAISTALQSAAVHTVVVEDFEDRFDIPRTKDFIYALRRWGVQPAEHSLVFSINPSENFVLSSRNVKTVKIITPRSLNLYDVLRADKLVLTKSAVDYLNRMYNISTDLKDENDDNNATNASRASLSVS